ncbi:MAG: hypothetical protein J6E32_06430, partial [Lachnospiraceae bacterium]|nr:hypothetical protein [Lachnospiraceae bacterium]
SDRHISIELTEAAREHIAEGGYDPAFGARPLRRYIQKNVETLAARMILSGEVLQGSTIRIDLADGELQAYVS